VVLIAGGGLVLGACCLLLTHELVVGAVVSAAALAALVVESRRTLRAVVVRKQEEPIGRAVWAGVELVLYLAPIALLSVAYPIASHHLSDTEVGGTRLTTLLLASSVTVPWLTQAVSLPLYRAIAPLVAAGENEKIVVRLCQVWPTTFVQCLPVVVLFTVPVEISTRWTPTAIGTYFCLAVLYMAFAQSLIPSIAFRKRGQWACAWLGVAIALLVAPSLWFLPPLVGLATQLVPLRRHWAVAVHPDWLHPADLARDVLRGLLLGAVLWSDKYFLFLRAGDHFAVAYVYVALLPAVLAYNYYFVRLAPGIDTAITRLRRAMEDAPYGVLARRSRTVYRFVTRSLFRSALVGVVIAGVVTAIVADAHPRSAPLVAAVAAASWLAMMITLLCYKLDYIGQSGPAQVFSAVYLVGCAGAFFVLPLGASAYVGLIGLDLLLFAFALRSTLAHWKSPEYSLFWRHATAW